MTVRLVARVELDTMASRVLYPHEERKEERVALLAGIVQLVQAALGRGGSEVPKRSVVQYMKSHSGVVGYSEVRGGVYLCEADSEKEAGTTLRLVLSMVGDREVDMMLALDKALRKKGQEISSLWG